MDVGLYIKTYKYIEESRNDVRINGVVRQKVVEIVKRE
jgi:hypothetical protein